MIARLARFAALPLAACALGLLCALQLLCVLRAPSVSMPSRIDVALRPGEELVLGRQELAAPQAAAEQLALRRDGAGRWWMRSAATARPLAWEHAGAERRTGSTALRAGQRFQLGAITFDVDAADGAEVSFADGARHWRYDGAVLLRDGQALPPCPGERLAVHAAALWNRQLPRALRVPRPLSFGGNLVCGNRIGIAGVPPHSAFLARGADGLLLAAAGGPGRTPLMLSSGDGVAADLAQREVPLDEVSALVAGRTRLLAQLDGGVLTLRPVSHVALFTGRQVQLPPQAGWRWRLRDPWGLPAPAAWLAVLAAGALGAALACLAGGRSLSTAARMHCAAGLLLAAAGVAALLLQRAGTPPGFGLSMLLAWAALWYALLAPGRLNLASATGVLLLAIGLLFQLELGFGAMESSWVRHFQKTAALLPIGLGAAGCIRLGAFRLSQAGVERLLLLFAGVALAGLLLEVVVGDETGVFDLQPVEFAKFALAALSAHCLALGLGSKPEASGALLRWLRLSAPALLFLALLGLALVQVDDYSPLILLLVWGGAMLLAWALASRRHMATGALAGLACAMALGVVGLRSAGAAEVSQWTFYADRFLVWLDPATHPHTGQQMLLAARAIADGGWWGADSLLGLASLGQDVGSAMRIPAVQDDFAPSFFLNRHGLAAGLALWSLQALFLAGLLRTALRAWAGAVRSRDFRQAWLARFRCFALCGGAAFVLGHLLLSWGTNLAIFPIMGQPMSFLSAGGSHLLFFICPLLAAASASVQSFEEIQSCRSTSNMKS
jgi:cell division protein FtsW